MADYFPKAASEGVCVLLFCFFQTQKLVEEGDINAALNEFQTKFYCRLLAWIWAAAFGPLFIIAVILGVVFGILRSQ